MASEVRGPLPEVELPACSEMNVSGLFSSLSGINCLSDLEQKLKRPSSFKADLSVRPRRIAARASTEGYA